LPFSSVSIRVSSGSDNPYFPHCLNVLYVSARSYLLVSAKSVGKVLVREMSRLLDPITIGRLRLKNRLVMPPMATGKASLTGEVTDDLVEHYVKRAAGPGLIIVEHSYVSLRGRSSLRQLGIHDNKLVSGLAKLVGAVHDGGAAVAIQINHVGSATTSEVCGMVPMAPSPVRNPRDGRFDVPRAMSVKEIRDTVEAFAKAAGRAAEAGFDAVEVHGAHGFLIGQFISPLTNLRLDDYGGVLENRARFAVGVVERVREEVGRDFPVLYRLGCEDMLPGGLTLDDGKHLAKIIVDAGADVIDVSGGLGSMETPKPYGEGFFVPQAEAIRRVINVPVIGVGGIKTPEFADGVVRGGRVDLVAVGRAMLLDAEWGLKALRALEREV